MTTFQIPIIDFLFYKMYKFGIYIKLIDSQFSALTAIVLLEIFNIVTILDFLDIKFSLIKPISLALFLLLLLFNYLLFLRKKRFIEIQTKYDQLDKKSNRIGGFIVVLYILVSIFFVLYFL
jgi:hypothetical protein